MRIKKKPKTSKSESTNTTVVSGGRPRRKIAKIKLFNMKYSKPAMVIGAFMVIGIGGIAFVRGATTMNTLWSASDKPKVLADADIKSVELGVKFQSKYAGKVIGVKFYKSVQNTGKHTGTLWDGTGNKLATVTFTNESSSGWQTAYFPQKVNIAANVTYIISYHAPRGRYSKDTNYFASQARVRGVLTAPQNSAGSPNGVFAYSRTTTFPRSAAGAANYWVDVIVSTETVTPPAAPAPPTKVTAVQEGTAIAVGWNAGYSSSTITKYKIYRNNAFLSEVSGTVLKYTDSAVEPGKTYSYRVSTVDGSSTSSVLSVPASVTYTVTPPPTCPDGQTGTPPNCVTETCPTGQTGTPPNCVTPPPSAYPTAATTGVPAGTTLTRSSRTRFETAGEVVQGLDLGCIEIVASNVTIKNSRVTCVNSQTGTTASIDGTHWSNAFKNLTIENVTIEGVHYRAIELMPYSTVRNVKIVGQGRGIDLDPFSKVENSYISLDNSNSNCSNAFGEGHATAMAFFSSHDVVIKNNHIEMKAERYPADACISGLIAVYPEKLHGGPSYNAVFDHNRLVLPASDRHYHISLSYSPGEAGSDIPNHHIQVVNNRFEGRNGHLLWWNSFPQPGDVNSNNKWCPNPYGSTNGEIGCSVVTPVLN